MRTSRSRVLAPFLARALVVLAVPVFATAIAACGDSGGSGDANDAGSSGQLPDGATPPHGDDGGTPPHGDDAGGGNDAGGGDDDGSIGGGGDDAGKDGSTPSKGIKTVFVIVMENHNWDSITGSGSATYIKSLLPQSSYCDNYFDNPKSVHPSEPNYIWMEAGDNLGFTDDSDPSASHVLKNTDHLTGQLTAKGISWKSYQEDLTAGQCGTKSSGHYAAKHNPMVFFSDVSGDPPSNTNAGCTDHVKPYSALAADLTANTVARYNFITPNLCNDMHDVLGCSTVDQVKNGDTWLSTEVPKILASQAYKDNGALFITWDES